MVTEMFEKYYPYEYLPSVFDIDYRKLYRKGFRGLIFDIDNTLVHHGDDSTEEVDHLFLTIHEIGFKTVLLTDNVEERVLRFLKNIDSMYICEAGKPDVSGYLRALEMMNLKKEEAVVIGDQIFTDILGANKSGIPSILVKFIQADPNEKIGKKRQLEKRILACYKRNPACVHRLGDICVRKEGE